jgi:hypothetical protein
VIECEHAVGADLEFICDGADLAGDAEVGLEAVPQPGQERDRFAAALQHKWEDADRPGVPRSVGCRRSRQPSRPASRSKNATYSSNERDVSSMRVPSGNRWTWLAGVDLPQNQRWVYCVGQRHLSAGHQNGARLGTPGNASHTDHRGAGRTQWHQVWWRGRALMSGLSVDRTPLNVLDPLGCTRWMRTITVGHGQGLFDVPERVSGDRPFGLAICTSMPRSVRRAGRPCTGTGPSRALRTSVNRRRMISFIHSFMHGALLDAWDVARHRIGRDA